MKIILLFLTLFCLCFSVFPAEKKEKRIVHYKLDTERIFDIPVFLNAGVTTIMFPAELEAIHAANVALNVIPRGTSPSFLLSYQNGSYYFSVRALKQKATGFLNIIYGTKTYIIRLYEDSENAVSSVAFQGGTGRSRRGWNNMSVSPYLLKSCLDKAKVWDVLQKRNDPLLEEVTVCDDQHAADYGTYAATVSRVWRFNKYDLLVFYIILDNKSDDTLYYRPRQVALSVSDKKCFAALADASGVMPPNSRSIMYLVVTGTNDGIRHLQPVNNWKVLIFPQSQPTVNVPKLPEKPKKGKK